MCLNKRVFKDLRTLVHYADEERLLRHVSDGSTPTSLHLLCITAATFGAGGWRLAPMRSRRGGIKEDTTRIADRAVRPRHAASPFPTEPAAASPATQGGKSPLRPSGDSAGSSGLARAG